MKVVIEIDTEKIVGSETYEKGANKAVAALLAKCVDNIKHNLHFSPGFSSGIFTPCSRECGYINVYES